MNVKIIVDSTCDLPRDLFEELDIGVVTLYVLLGEVSYREWQEITPEEVVAWSNKTDKPPTTSAPSVDDFLKAFKSCEKAKQDIVFIGTSSETTATCQVAQIAADMVKGVKVQIIDGRSISAGTACIAYKAAKLAQ
ncbi:MAG: DegV family EDD domain-containing protein [Clostridia bacterium]|nr:DegV family EDD domain-containing protein [Clostridia bacterium]